MNENISIRRLAKNDTNIFFNLRLEALQNSPASFLSLYEEEKVSGPSFFENILCQNGIENIIFGAFVNNKLVGSIGIFQEARATTKHKCTIWGIYIQPAYRKRGIAKALMEIAIKHAKNSMHCSIVNLSVETTNVAAKKLYQSYGFEVWGIEPNAKQLHGKFYDSCHMALLIYTHRT